MSPLSPERATAAGSTTADSPRSTAVRAGLSILAIVVVSTVLNTVVAVIARAAGASSKFQALKLPAYLSFTVIGVLIGTLVWVLMRRSERGRDALAWLVPVVLVISLVPDVLVGATHGQPHTTWTAVVGLMVMHVVVVVTAATTLRRLLPLR